MPKRGGQILTVLLCVVIAFITSQLGFAMAGKLFEAQSLRFAGFQQKPGSYTLRPYLTKVGMVEQGTDTNGNGTYDQWQVSVVQQGLSINYMGRDTTSDGHPDEVKVFAYRAGGLTDLILVDDRNADGSPDLIEITLSREGTSDSYVTYDDYDASGDWDAEFTFRNGIISQIRLRFGDMWRVVKQIENEQELTFRDQEQPDISYRFHDGQWQSQSTPSVGVRGK